MGDDRIPILVVGGSGYLGRFLIDHFARDPRYDVAYTYHSNPPSMPSYMAVSKEKGDTAIYGSVASYRVDLETGMGLAECLKAVAPLIICNCAAISQPALCEKEPDKATSINVPSALVEAALEMPIEGRLPLMIHMSTDQVYDGTRSNWTENDLCAPVNAYGKSKLQGEEYIRKQYPNHVILRSSIIFGRELPMQWPKAPDSRPLFTQFIDRVLCAQEATTFFSDEYRNPIYVQDICEIFQRISSREVDRIHTGAPQAGEIMNMGGPERLSRVDMAMAIAEIRGYNKDCIIPSKSADVERPYVSPPDISMDSSLLSQELSISPLDFKSAMTQVFDSEYSHSSHNHTSPL